MDPAYTFFNAKGRLSPSQFGQGFVVLSAIVVVVTVLASLVSSQFGALNWLLIFPYVCLFGKRLHDASQSAWFYLLIVLGYFMLSIVFTAVTMGYLSPEAAAMQEEYQSIAIDEGFSEAFAQMADSRDRLARSSALTSLAAVLFSHAVIGWGVMQMKSDPNANRYGPPTTGPYAGPHAR